MPKEDKVFTSALSRRGDVKNNLYELIAKADDIKVFFSDIGREGIAKNNLYELIEIEPVKPIVPITEVEDNFNYTYNKEKYYVSKKYSKFSKVRTVRNIRSELEDDMYLYLNSDLEKQESYLLKKIRCGYSGDEKTLQTAKKILTSGRPLSRSSLQMLANINPEKYSYSQQYVLWNGLNIRVSGSIGGAKKFICNFDLGKQKKIKNNRFKAITKNNNRKKLLIKSLATKFKPGPLMRKSTLDESYQKFNVGTTEIVKLPRIGLNVQPCLGSAIEPTICDILHILNKDNDQMTKTWAEYSVSALFGNEKQTHNGVTFSLPYKNNQKNIIMRRDVQNVNKTEIAETEYKKCAIVNNDVNIFKEVTDILVNILDSVEISLNQDNMYTGEDSPRIDDADPQLGSIEASHNPKKDKLKKNKELERLDVTVIRLPDTQDDQESPVCRKAHCLKGCLCASLNCEFKLKNHCGRVECMFECKCDFSRYKAINCVGSIGVEGILPGLFNLGSEINSKLAKEEQKFRQTVIVTDEKSILLKSQRRNLKTPKRYVEYFEGVSKRENKSEKFLTIPLVKLPICNIEPWCMVHNLYKCFCKGIFTEKASKSSENITVDHHKSSEQSNENNLSSFSKTNSKTCITKVVSTNVEEDLNLVPSIISKVIANDGNKSNDIYAKCARTTAFKGKKYNEKFYRATHSKIRKLEENDKSLINKMNTRISLSEGDSSCETIDLQNVPDESTSISLEPDNNQHKVQESDEQPVQKKSKLILWLEANYKHYKRILTQGNKKIIMDPPQPGKIALYPWEIILERYRLKKNYFLVTKEPPYRMFMSVDKTNSFFDNCIPIEQIPFAELRNFPLTIKNLLDGAFYVNDNFYILAGLPFCWEMIGSVTKLADKNKEIGGNTNKQNNFTYTQDESTQNTENIQFNPLNECKIDKITEQCPDSFSKWFVMTVENDFSEIQFHDKGFFVKLDNILKAIDVSRSSKKTVRLSSNKKSCNDTPQFGIYAVPEMSRRCVFIGPYEKNERLGLEIIKKPAFKKSTKRTRGHWIFTKKMDDFKVIDNPLHFYTLGAKNENVINIENESEQKEDAIINENISANLDVLTNENRPSLFKSELTEDESESPAKKQRNTVSVKVIKPITISKSNPFFTCNVKKDGKKISLVKLSPVKNAKIINDESNLISVPIIKDTFSLANTSKERLFDDGFQITATTSKPVAEIAPQIKSAVSKQREKVDDTGNTKRRPEGGMLILKPEEINQRLLNSQQLKQEPRKTHNADLMNTDIENFLATSQILTNIEDVFEISDDEKEAPIAPEPKFQQVWIEPKDIENLGWIPGRRNTENLISFEFPGFKYTAFYPEEEALNKIVQVLSRKVYVPKLFPIQWRIVDSPDQLVSKKQMQSSDLGSQYMLTKSGLQHKDDLLRKTYRGPLKRPRSVTENST